jgi:hypothetical protein
MSNFNLRKYLANNPLTEDYSDYEEFGKNIIIQAYDWFDEAVVLDSNKINLQNSIHFTSTLEDFNRRKNQIQIGKDIFNQILELYKGTSLEQYNKKYNYTPKYYLNDGNMEAVFLNIQLAFYEVSQKMFDNPSQKNYIIERYLEVSLDGASYNPSNDSISKMAASIAPKFNIDYTDSESGTTLDPELEAILETVPVNFIPYVEFQGEMESFNNKIVSSHVSKGVIKECINELGLLYMGLQTK